MELNKDDENGKNEHPFEKLHILGFVVTTGSVGIEICRDWEEKNSVWIE